MQREGKTDGKVQAREKEVKLFPKELGLEGKLYKLVFLEVIWNTGNGAVGLIKSLAGDFLLVVTVLKVFGLERYWWLVIMGGVAYVVGVFFLGLFLFRKNIIARRGNVGNKIGNPQLLNIERGVERIERKLETK